MPRISSVAAFKNSSQVIAYVIAPLYFNENDIVLDVTYGKGNFWSIFEPQHLIKHDLFLLDGIDCRNLPEEDYSIDIVVLDLPLISKGGRKTTTIKKFDTAYGLKRAPKTPEGVHEVIVAGMKESFRVLSVGGILICKITDYISGGKYYQARHNVVRDAMRLGFIQLDEIIHYRGNPGPQPKRNIDGSKRRQVHSHRAHSFYCVFIKP